MAPSIKSSLGPAYDFGSVKTTIKEIYSKLKGYIKDSFCQTGSYQNSSIPADWF